MITFIKKYVALIVVFIIGLVGLVYFERASDPVLSNAIEWVQVNKEVISLVGNVKNVEVMRTTRKVNSSIDGGGNRYVFYIKGDIDSATVKVISLKANEFSIVE